MDSKAIIGAVQGVTAKWTKQRKAEERHTAARLRRWDVMTRSRSVTIKDAAYEVMEAAYLKASANNTLPAKARQVMYAARGKIQERPASRSTIDTSRKRTHLLKQAEESSPETAEEMRSDRAERMKTIDQDDPAFDIP